MSLPLIFCKIISTDNFLSINILLNVISSYSETTVSTLTSFLFCLSSLTKKSIFCYHFYMNVASNGYVNARYSVIFNCARVAGTGGGGYSLIILPHNT